MLPKVFAVPLMLLLRPLLPLPKIFDAPPLLLLPNILGAPLLALLAMMLMEALPKMPPLLPKMFEDPLVLTLLFPKMLLLPPVLLVPKMLVGTLLLLIPAILLILLLPSLPAAPVLLFSLLKMLAVPLLPFPKMLA